MTKEKFLLDGSNKSALLSIMSTKLTVSNISSICCRDDSGTTIVKENLQYLLVDNVAVVAEDADILIILIHHFDINIQGNQNINLERTLWPQRDRKQLNS